MWAISQFPLNSPSIRLLTTACHKKKRSRKLWFEFRITAEKQSLIYSLLTVHLLQSINALRQLSSPESWRKKTTQSDLEQWKGVERRSFQWKGEAVVFLFLSFPICLVLTSSLFIFKVLSPILSCQFKTVDHLSTIQHCNNGRKMGHLP